MFYCDKILFMNIHQENSTMQILSPLKDSKEVLPLSYEGADAFYCGLMDTKSALNDRPNTAEFNFVSVKDLQEAVVIAHAQQRKVFLVINHLNPDIQRAMQQVDIAVRLKIDGVVLANFFLMEKVKSLKVPLEIHASCLMTTFNSMTAQFLKQCGAHHIHLPRHVGFCDIASLIKNTADVSFGVFAVSGMCINIEAFCLLHTLTKKECFPCLHFKPQQILKQQEIDMMTLEQKMNSPKEACALCALPVLQGLGVKTLKIEGREEPLEQKRQHVRLLKQGFMLMNQVKSKKNYILKCQQIFKETYQMSCQEQYCYF